MKTQDIKNMAGALQQVRESNLEEKKKMDPVGQADADIDNDGDVDNSDKYLHNRRKAISKNVKKGDDNEVIMNPKQKKGQEVTELSKKTLGDYVTQASDDQADHAQDQGKHYANNAGYKGAMASIKRDKRSDGIKTAVKKLMRKEEAEEQSWPVYARILEKNSEHYKGTAPNDKVDDLDSPGAAKMRADIKGEVIDYQKMSVDSMQAALKAGPVSNAQRPNDNKAGDKSVVSPVKGKT